MASKLGGVGEGMQWKHRKYFNFQHGKYGTTMVYHRFDLKRQFPWILATVLGLIGAYFLIRH